MQTPMTLGRYLRHHLLGAALINGLLTAGLTVWLTKGTTIPLWGEKGLATETVLATIGVTILTVLLASPAIRREIRRGKVDRLPWTPASHGVLRLGCYHTGGRALLFAIGGTALFASTAIFLWAMLGPSEAPFGTFLAYKIGYVVALGSVATPLNILWVLSDRRPQALANSMAGS